MRTTLFIIGMLAVMAFWSGSAPAQDTTAATKACLSCHGPFSKLVEATSAYVAPSKEKGSPHRYVPHDSKRDEDIPACTGCHTAHPTDAPPAKGTTKSSVGWCYSACHHEQNLTSCKQCHP